MEDTDFATDFKRFREENDMSQAMLARTLGLVLRTVQGIEAGEHRPSYTSRMRFKELKRRYEQARMVQ
jgi:DNA-binding XRE family transcriptional regulator